MCIRAVLTTVTHLSSDKRRSRTGSLAPSALGSGRPGSRAGSVDLLGVADELQGFDDGEMLMQQGQGGTNL